MTPIDTSNWDQVGPQLATMPGGKYENTQTGQYWYVKSPASERQRRNEVLASAVYRAMDFTAVEVHPTADGRVASKWIEDLPAVTTPAELRRRPEAFDAFLPSALVAHWDVVGLEYDNMLPHPTDGDGVVLLDFGGTFDTRARGGHKEYTGHTVPSLEGFLDREINPTAPDVFEAMTRRDFERSKVRLRSLSSGDIDRLVGRVFPDTEAEERARVLRDRRDLLSNTAYGDVF